MKFFIVQQASAKRYYVDAFTKYAFEIESFDIKKYFQIILAKNATFYIKVHVPTSEVQQYSKTISCLKRGHSDTNLLFI